MMKLFVLVPVFNEAENLAHLFSSFQSLALDLQQFQDIRVHIVLMDDGSRDNTGDKARALAGNMPFTLLTHSSNQGPGKAFATGFTFLPSQLEDTDWVLTIEGDNTSRIELIRQMFIRTREGYDVVLASPYMYGGGIANTSMLRTALSHIANAFVKELLGIHGILTMSSFFRLYRGSVIRKLQKHYGPAILERNGFESMIELLLKMLYLQTTISEVPMLLDTSRRKGKSKMKILKTIYGYLTLWKDKGKWISQSRRPIQ